MADQLKDLLSGIGEFDCVVMKLCGRLAEDAVSASAIGRISGNVAFLVRDKNGRQIIKALACAMLNIDWKYNSALYSADENGIIFTQHIDSSCAELSAAERMGAANLQYKT